jgi:hypothetical protein
MSNNVSSNFSSYTCTIEEFENIATSFAMIEFSPASTKTKRVIGIIWYLHLKEVDAFIEKIRVA